MMSWGLRNDVCRAGQVPNKDTRPPIASGRGCASIQYAGGSRRPALDPPMAQASVARARRSGGVALDPEDGNIFGEAADC